MKEVVDYLTNPTIIDGIILLVIGGVLTYTIQVVRRFITNQRRKRKEKRKLRFLKYTKDTFDGREWTWNYEKEEDKYVIHDLKTFCTVCESFQDFTFRSECNTCKRYKLSINREFYSYTDSIIEAISKSIQEKYKVEVQGKIEARVRSLSNFF